MKDVLKLANESGFPLQLAVAAAVEDGTASHGWRVSSHEHPWAKGKEEGFADLVLERPSNEIVRLVVECKKQKTKDLLFFVPGEDAQETSRCRIRWGFRTSKRAYPGGWADVDVSPLSLESQFCVVVGEGADKRRSMLERTAHDLVMAADAICDEEIDLTEDDGMGSEFVYIPVLVTTAKLMTCRFDPKAVSLDSGEIGSDAKIDEVPAIRFRKALTTNSVEDGADSSLDEARRRKEHSIIVVNAGAIESFLADWRIAAQGGLTLPWDALRQQIQRANHEKWVQRELDPDS